MSKIGYLLRKTQICWKSPNLIHFGIKLRKYINFKRSHNFTFSLIFPRWCSRGVLTFIFITIKFTLVMVSYKPYNKGIEKVLIDN